MNATTAALYALIPVRARPIAKAIVAGAGGAATAVVPLLPAVPDWLAAILAALTLAGVYKAENAPATPAGYTPEHGSA